MTTVLVVDSDIAALQCERDALEAAGFGVRVATSSTVALQRVATEEIDAVITAALSPSADGLRLCRTIRDQDAAIPIILVAKEATQQFRSLASMAGASACVEHTFGFVPEIDALRACLAWRTECQNERCPPGADGRYQALFETTSASIAFLTRDGIILDANAAWEQSLGYTPAEMIGRPIGDFSAPGARAANLGVFASSANALRSLGVLQHKNGSVVFMEFAKRELELSGETIICSVGHDVTEHVLTRQKLEDAEREVRSVFDHVPVVLFTVDERNRLTYVSPNAERFFGAGAAQNSTLEQRFARVHPDDAARVRATIENSWKTRDPVVFEWRLRDEKGQWMHVETRMFAVYERNGVLYADGMLTDVTERKALEAHLRQAQKMEAIGLLSGGIAHDFNNMLAAILANAQILLDDLSDSDPRRVEAEQIRAAAERAACLTRQLLAFSRRQMLMPVVLDLNCVVKNLEKMLRRLIGEHITLSLHCPADPSAVRADCGQLEQVVMNLVVNARDAMPNGGAIEIETENVDGRTLSPPIEGKLVALRVRDNGSGMDKDTLARIFEPFFTTKPDGKGTGLGLSTCYGIVEQSGGSIRVESERGSGTTFSVYLPLVDEEPENDCAGVRRGDDAARPQRRATVLLVEDEPQVRAAMERVLADAGYKVLVARNADEAIAQADCHPFDVVVSDVVMPHMSGPDLVTMLRGRQPGLPAIFMSGYTDHPMLRNPSRTDVFLQKPFAPAVLARSVSEVLDRC